MRDARISATLVFAYACWTVAAILTLMTFFLEPPMAAVGIYFTAMATVAHVKSFLIHLEERERTAYELGRESVHQLRR